MSYLPLFKMPKPMKITGRSSSITNAFINSIIPVIYPTEDEVKEALDVLEMPHNEFQCCYCGSDATEWDHLRPLVLNKKPTGYISEIHNLVPSCGKCNQSKGNKEWRKWMVSDAPLSPKSKGIVSIEERMRLLGEYEKWKKPTKMDFASIVGDETWEKHWNNWSKIIELMQESQVTSETINTLVATAYKKL